MSCFPFNHFAALSYCACSEYHCHFDSYCYSYSHSLIIRIVILLLLVILLILIILVIFPLLLVYDSNIMLHHIADLLCALL